MSNQSSNQTSQKPMDVTWSHPSKYYVDLAEDDHSGTLSTPPRSKNRWVSPYGPYPHSNHGERWGYQTPPPPQGHYYRGYGYYEEYYEHNYNYASSVPVPPSHHDHYQRHPYQNGSSSYADEPCPPPREFLYSRHHEHVTLEAYLWEDEESVIPKPPFEKAPPTQVTPFPSRKRSSSEITQEDVRDEGEDHRHKDHHHHHHDRTRFSPNDSNVIGTLGPHDIVCGRGAPVTWNEGNRRFQDLIVARQTEYLSSKRSDKPEVATRILELIKTRGGRFVRRVKNAHQGRFGWEKIEERRAYEKVCQSLREKAPEIRRKMIASSIRTNPSVFFERPEEKENWSEVDSIEPYQI